MQAISIEEAPKYLAALEHGESFIITHGKKAIAQLIPLSAKPAGEGPRPKVGEGLDEQSGSDDSAFKPMRMVYEHDLPGYGRPKVGEIVDRSFVIPKGIFAPMTDEELKEWGL